MSEDSKILARLEGYLEGSLKIAIKEERKEVADELSEIMAYLEKLRDKK